MENGKVRTVMAVAWIIVAAAVITMLVLGIKTAGPLLIWILGSLAALALIGRTACTAGKVSEKHGAYEE